MNISFDDLVRYLFIGIGVLSAISSFVGGAQKKRVENEKLERELRQLEEKRREANPNTQSYTTYLERTRAETLNDDSAPDALGHSKRQPHVDLPEKTGSFLDDFQVAGQNPKPQSEQDRLREEMARKMGRPVTQTTQPPQPQPQTPPVLGPFEAFEKMLRDLEQKANPTPEPPKQKRRQKPQAAPAPTPQTQIQQANGPKPSAPPNTTPSQPTSALWSVAPNDMVRAIVMSEILGAPKARRR